MKTLTIWQPFLSRPYVAGVLHGDGWCTSKTLGLRCKDADFAETFAGAVNDICGTQLSPATDERGYSLVRTSNRRGRFNRLRAHQPTDNDELGWWLRGLFDSEGNAQLWLNKAAGPASFHRRVASHSTGLPTLERAAEYLDWLDVPNGIRATRNSATHKGTKTVFELRMLRQEGFSRFAEMVGSSIARKRANLEAIVASYQPAGWQARNWQKAVLARHPHLAGGTS